MWAAYQICHFLMNTVAQTGPIRDTTSLQNLYNEPSYTPQRVSENSCTLPHWDTSSLIYRNGRVSWVWHPRFKITKPSFFTRKSSIANTFPEQIFKILSCWYQVPAVLDKIFLQTSNLFKRCSSEVGTLLHIFWSCPKVCPFWEGVRQFVLQLTSVDLVIISSAIYYTLIMYLVPDLSLL